MIIWLSHALLFFCRAFVRILCACCPGRVRRRYQPAFRCKPSQVSMKYSYLSYKLCTICAYKICARSASSLFPFSTGPKPPSTENNPVGGYHKLPPSHVPRFYLGKCNDRSVVFVFDSAKAPSPLTWAEKEEVSYFKASYYMATITLSLVKKNIVQSSTRSANILYIESR